MVGQRPADPMVELLEASAAPALVMTSVRDDGGVVVDFECLLANRAARELVSGRAEPLHGRRFAEVMPGAQALLARCVEVVESGEPFEDESHWHGEDGDRWGPIHVRRVALDGDGGADGRDGVVVVFDDRTTERRLVGVIDDLHVLQKDLEAQALRDPLTGLANRLLVETRLDHGISRLDRHSTLLVVMFVDLDRLKAINDSLGHAAGDVVLRTIAGRLRTQARPYDTVGRLGGDEFIVVCEDVGSVHDVDRIARRMLSACGEPIDVHGDEVGVGVSIGIAIADTASSDSTTLIGAADAAMYRAKASGGERIAYADAEVEELLSARHDIEADLADAIESDHLVIDFEPVARADDGRVVAQQASVRWPHRGHEFSERDRLEEAAARLGIAGLLGDHLIDRALGHLSVLQTTNDAAPDFVIVDVSADVLCATGFVDRVCDTLRRRGMSSDALCLAVDGVEVARNEVTARAALERLHAFGVRIARDNVGAPGSPLTYFDGWPITLVRLDATLVAAIDDPGHRHLIVLVCDAANAAGRVTIAPAVHTATQAAALVGIGIDLLHGPHITDGEALALSRIGGDGAVGKGLAIGTGSDTTPQVGHISLRPVLGVGDEIVDFEWSSIDPHAGRLIGRPAAALVGRTILTSIHDSVNRAMFDRFVTVMASGVTSTVDHGRTLDGTDSAFVTEAVRCNDTVEVTVRPYAVRAPEKRALRDPLTGLADRVLVEDRVDHAIERLWRRHACLAVLFIDIDRFHVINDSLGHATGDILLCEVANRLKSVARPADTVGRLGGDTFVVLCEDLRNQRDADRIARRFLDDIRRPFRLDGREVAVTASIGAVTADSVDMVGTAGLFRDADRALHLAKQGRHDDSVYFSDARLHEHATSRLDLEIELRTGIRNDQLEVFYQPIVSTNATDHLVGVEALVRWNHPRHGLMRPDSFIPIAEETGLVVPLGAVVLEQALAQLAIWHRDFPDTAPGYVAVNVAAGQLAERGLGATVLETIESAGLAPGALCVEVTETSLLRDPVAAQATIHELSSAGVNIALDDFGTGYSSLSQLRTFPVDVIKIDQSFTEGIVANAGDRALVQAINHFAASLDKSVVAEGVETHEQLEVLRRIGVQLVQGNHVSTAVPADGFVDFLEARSRGRASGL